MERSYIDVAFEIKKEDVEETGIFKGYGSIFGNKDSYGHIVVPGAFTKTLKRNGHTGMGVAMLRGHDTRRPIGIWNLLEEDKKGLKVEGQLAMEIQDGKETHELMKMGALKGLSIGYDTLIYEDDIKKKVRYLKELDLWEISPVVFPANVKAKITVVKDLLTEIEQAKNIRELESFLRDSKDFSKNEAQRIISIIKASLRDSETIGKEGLSLILDGLKDVNKDLEFGQQEVKGVIPFKSYSKAPEGEKWDAGVQVKAASVKDMKMMCTWFNDANPDVKGSYKLPHHKAKGYKTVWRGVANAMARLLQPATAIPKDDKKGCHSHLGKHYKEFNKPVPEFKEYVQEKWADTFPEQVAEIAMEDKLSGILDSLITLNA